MISEKEIEKLAHLARIKLTPAEKTEFVGEIDEILNYVGQISKLSVSGEVSEDREVGVVYNVMRDDINAHEPELYTNDILKQAPKIEGKYLKVKKIL